MKSIKICKFPVRRRRKFGVRSFWSASFINALFAASGFIFFTSVLDAKILDRIVATVNGNAIFYSDFSARIKPFEEQLEMTVTDKDEKEKQTKRLKKQVLDSMIEEKVLLNKAKGANIQITESEIDQGLSEIRSRFKTEEEYKTELAKQGLTLVKMRSNIKEQLTTIKLINQEVRSAVPEPTEKEIRNFYDKNEDKMIVGEQVRVKQIFFEFKQDVPKAELLKKANSALAKVKKNPAEFADLAEKYSDAQENTSDTGYFARGEKIPQFEEPCFKLNVGEISNVVETPLGFHIVKCVGKKAPEKKTFAESKDYIKNYLFTTAMEEKYALWVRDLRDQAAIKILDKEFLDLR